MQNLGSLLRAAAVAAFVALAALMPHKADAQTVTQLPVYVDNNPGVVTDLGNGPMELRILQGSAQLFTSSSSGTTGNTLGTSSTTLPLTATPLTANAPLVGGIISGTGITSGTTVAAYSGTGITLSAAMTVGTAITVSWGVACPATVGSTRVMLVQTGVGADLPLYTQARVCGAGQNAAGAAILPFAIGAH